MSYILSALKKAEQERTDITPLAASLLAAQVDPQDSGPVRWLWFGLLAMAILLLASLAWFLLTGPAAVTAPVTVPPATETTSASASRQPESLKPARVVPALSSAREPFDRQPTQAAPLAVSSQVARPELPIMNIEGHIFVEGRPAASKLFIDGQAWRSGDTLPNGVTVGDIAVGSVGVQYRGLEYQVPVE